MKLRGLLGCWMVCLSLSLFSATQERSQIGGDVKPTSDETVAATVTRSPDASGVKIFARNAATEDGPSPALGVSPTLLEPMLAAHPAMKQGPQSEHPLPSQSQIRIWKGLAIAEHSAAFFDAWSTRAALASGNGYERDPLMKPFANSAAIYPMLQIAPFGVDYLSHRFMRSNHVLLRRIWWLPQAVSLGSSMWCGARNVHVADLKR
jgi:hypothetical protein